MTALAAHRRFYAELITKHARVRDARIEDAFATVPREDFMGPGPWQVWTPDGYIETPSADPSFLYQDVLVALIADQGLNNGQPSLHAGCLDAVSPQPGEEVLQIGVGTGYYTAILAELVAGEGAVRGLEIDAGLAAQATANLLPWPAVTVAQRSGTEAPLPDSDVIYISASASAPHRLWLEALQPSGRLIFALAPEFEYGAMLLITRCNTGYRARFVMRAAFVACDGGQDARLTARLKEAFADESWREVRSLRLAPEAPDDSCWFADDDWWLSTADL